MFIKNEFFYINKKYKIEIIFQDGKNIEEKFKFGIGLVGWFWYLLSKDISYDKDNPYGPYKTKEKAILAAQDYFNNK